jgi:hypothetical protein
MASGGSNRSEVVQSSAAAMQSRTWVASGNEGPTIMKGALQAQARDSASGCRTPRRVRITTSRGQKTEPTNPVASPIAPIA